MSRSKLAQLTLDLCRIPSVTGQEEACTQWIAKQLSPLPISRCGQTIAVRIDAPRQDGTPAPLILLAGHTDTVPLKKSDGIIEAGPDGLCFSQPPYQTSDRIYGLGSSDMKAGLAVMIALAQRFVSQPSSRFSVGMVFYDREEGPWRESGLGPALECIPWLKDARLVFCLEPSDNILQVGCVGSMHATVRFPGKAAHSARPWQGHNAIHAAGALLGALHARPVTEAIVGGQLFREVISATLAQGGVGRNVIPESFEINLNYRFLPGKSLDQAQAELLQFVHAHAPDAQVILTDRSPSGRVVTDSALLQDFLARTQAPVTAKQAWTDVARFSELGIDAVNLGPGASAQAHQAGEWVETEKIYESYDQFLRFLTDEGE